MADPTPEERNARIVLAASRGVLSALTSDEPLGDAVRDYRIAPRTPEGDAFEHAFEWARELHDSVEKTLKVPAVAKAIREAEESARKKAFEEAEKLCMDQSQRCAGDEGRRSTCLLLARDIRVHAEAAR